MSDDFFSGAGGIRKDIYGLHTRERNDRCLTARLREAQRGAEAES